MIRDSSNLKDSELTDRCEKWVNKLCESKGKAWTLCIPPDHGRDPDLLITELIKRFKELKKRLGDEHENT